MMHPLFDILVKHVHINVGVINDCRYNSSLELVTLYQDCSSNGDSAEITYNLAEMFLW